MRAFFRFALIVIGLAGLTTACQKKADDSGSQSGTDTPATATQDPAAADPHARNKPGLIKPKPRVNIPPPMDVSKPPDNAIKTASGISYVVLSPGTEDAKPGRNDTVQVEYTGWKLTGEMFYTTQRRNHAQPMALNHVGPGWVEMLSDMKIGEERLVWMPPALASRAKVGPKKDPLVFQLKAVKFDPAPPVPDNVAAPPRDAKKSKAGFSYKILAKGTGSETPRWWDQVTVHYTGWSTDGRMFDSTLIRKRPRPMLLFRESKGWKEALQMMTVGTKLRAWFPEAVLNKRRGMPEGMLVYDIELTDIKRMADPPPVPDDVARPPANAKKTDKGVFYKILKKGDGKEHPTPDKTVKVHYTGWTTDGELFDSSIIKGKPSEFPLAGGLIQGWKDGIPVMVVGDKFRFWIPEKLAYQGKPGSPQGMLVFDVELLDIRDTPRRKRPQLPSLKDLRRANEAIEHQGRGGHGTGDGHGRNRIKNAPGQ